MLDQNSTIDFYNLFINTNQLLSGILVQLKRIADNTDTDDIFGDDNDDNDVKNCIDKNSQPK